MSTETTKGSWRRKTQRKKLAEVGAAILEAQTEEERESLIEYWHWVNQHWDEYKKKQGVYEDVDFENMAEKAGSLEG